MSDRIEDLEPHTRAMCELFLQKAALADIPLRVTHTRRTMDEQLHLWSKGRALHDGVWVVINPAAIVTKARPGASPHNYGMAFDICVAGPDPYMDEYGKDHKDEFGRPLPDPRWKLLGELGEECGLDWGGPLGKGDKFTWDRPHFQRNNWRAFIPKEGTA